jgi:ankyrin repeat protein
MDSVTPNPQKDFLEAQKTPVERLMDAATTGDIAQLETLFTAGVSLHSRDADGRTALQHAAGGSGQLEAVKWLLGHKADPSAADNNGETPLHWTCSRLENKQPGFDIMQALVEGGAKVDAKNKRGETPLIRAASRCPDTEPILYLIAHGARIDTVEPDCKFTALTGAAIEGMTHTVKLLLDLGQDINQRDQWGRSLIWHAASADRTATVELLLSRHADVFAKCSEGFTPRTKALFYDYKDMAARMAQAELDQNDRIIHEGIPGGVKPLKKLKLIR